MLTFTTKAVVFDFYGTLAAGKLRQTTWEMLWTHIGYDIKICHYYRAEFEAGRINLSEWCKITQEKFIERGLSISHLDAVAQKIKLIKGARRFFQFCKNNDINIYIVSGSILYIIQRVLGGLQRYVDTIEADQLIFNSNDTLHEIIVTKYDFDGKATFIKEIASKLNVSTANILFVGNSCNDALAHQSGARTLCINPGRTDPADKTVWNELIDVCDDLYDIVPYIYSGLQKHGGRFLS
jgi:HAD superfamily phosphoserine phosphatase-like hydrolase